jgi:antitoxin MazE
MVMQVQLARWGNSLGMRIPKDLATRLGLTEGAQVDVTAEGDRLVISAARPRYKIEELVSDLSNEALREAFDWGLDQGREIVE